MEFCIPTFGHARKGILDNKYAFKINMDDWQSKKLLPSTVKKMSADPDIINALIPMITPSKVKQVMPS